jgi:exodeoxyribonuclease-3
VLRDRYGRRVRIATWNVNSLKARMERVEAWLADVAPDVVCLQETKLADGAFPALAFQGLGYESAHHGEGRWNGVAILSRVGLSEVTEGFGPGDPDPEARLLWATCGGVRVASAYVPNGRALDHDHYRYKLSWLANLRRRLTMRSRPPSRWWWPEIQHRPDRRRRVGSGAVRRRDPPARRTSSAQDIVDWGWWARQVNPEPGLYSWWDYRAGRFHKHEGMRIDLVLATAPVAERVTFATIDRNARKGQQPSDHAPVIVDLAD